MRSGLSVVCWRPGPTTLCDCGPGPRARPGQPPFGVPLRVLLPRPAPAGRMQGGHHRHLHRRGAGDFGLRCRVGASGRSPRRSQAPRLNGRTKGEEGRPGLLMCPDCSAISLPNFPSTPDPVARQPRVQATVRVGSSRRTGNDEHVPSLPSSTHCFGSLPGPAHSALL